MSDTSSIVVRTLQVGALLLAFAAARGAGAAEDYKIGVINTERILREAAPAKDAARRIEEEFKAREAALAKLDRDLKDLAGQLDRDAPTLSAVDRAALQRDIDARGREIERTRRQLSEDLTARQFDEMNKIKERLDALLTRIAKEQGYDLILQDGVYVGRSVDMTESVIKALDSP
jgi:outer membrane protein